MKNQDLLSGCFLAAFHRSIEIPYYHPSSTVKFMTAEQNSLEMRHISKALFLFVHSSPCVLETGKNLAANTPK